MDSAQIRAAYELLEFEKPIKDEKRVKTKYRALVLKHTSDRVQDQEGKSQQDDLVRRIHEAKAICISFCDSPLSLEEIEQAGSFDAGEAQRKYLQMVQLFVGRILQRRFRFWGYVPLQDAEEIPEFEDTIPKYPLGNTLQAVTELLAREHGRDEVRWVLSFEGEDRHPMAWATVEMTDGTHQAMVFFHKAPGLRRVLPVITTTLLTIEAQVELLTQHHLRCLRNAKTGQTWGFSRSDTMVIRINGAGAALSWKMDVTPTEDFWINCQSASSLEDLEKVLPHWIERVKLGW